jgi:hypothetical protein
MVSTVQYVKSGMDVPASQGQSLQINVPLDSDDAEVVRSRGCYQPAGQISWPIPEIGFGTASTMKRHPGACPS